MREVEKVNDYQTVYEILSEVLAKARLPGADFDRLKVEVNNSDYGLSFPDRLPVEWAKFAVGEVLGLRNIKNKNKLANAEGKLASLSIKASEINDQSNLI